jgi:hypothetical protein
LGCGVINDPGAVAVFKMELVPDVVLAPLELSSVAAPAPGVDAAVGGGESVELTVPSALVVNVDPSSNV